jgi:hypothetical protein
MAGSGDVRRRALGLRETLTPHPHRGDLIAAGALPFAVGAVLIDLRFDDVWGNGVLLVMLMLATGLVLGMGVLAPLEGEQARPYQQVLLLAGLVLGWLALLRVARALGADDPLSSAGTSTWIFALVTIVAAWLTRARCAAICALVAALAGIVTVLSFVDWAFSPDGPGTTRWLLLVLACGLVLTALARRDVARRESVYLIDAAGVAILTLGLTFVAALIDVLTFLGAPGGAPGGGWKLVLLAVGFGLVAYAAVDREPGPGYLGALNLLLFLAFAALPGEDGASLWFWPLVLLALGGVAIAAGLRPRRELPPEPPSAAGPAEPVPGPGSPREPGGLWASGREPA